MEFMLTISTDTLPQSSLSYIAFRVSFLETLERMTLAQQMGAHEAECLGFLTEVPFLKATAPHVQLDALAETWCKHMSDDPFDATLVDEAVVYAVCETASRIVENDPETINRLLEGGPLGVDVTLDHMLASELRSLHLNLSNEGDFLMVSQFEDRPPEDAERLKKKFGIDDEKLEPLFDLLGLWLMSVEFLPNLAGLLTGREIVNAVKVLARR